MTKDNERYSRGRALFEALEPTALRALEDAFADIAPDLVRYAVEFPFGDIYHRPGLAKRDRQIATLACLATRGDAADQLRVHIRIALAMGIGAGEITETFIQLAPYAGFPTAINAVAALRAELVEGSADNQR